MHPWNKYYTQSSPSYQGWYSTSTPDTAGNRLALPSVALVQILRIFPPYGTINKKDTPTTTSTNKHGGSPAPAPPRLPHLTSNAFRSGRADAWTLFGRSVSSVACRSCRVRWAPATPAPRAWLLYVPLGASLSLPPSRFAPADTALPTFPLRFRARPSLHHRSPDAT